MYMNPAEFIIELVNTDFSLNEADSSSQLHSLHESWKTSPEATALANAIAAAKDNGDDVTLSLAIDSHTTANPILIPFTLIHRSFIKSYRDVVAYGIRVGMYMGLAILMGTVWLRLAPTQANIQNFTNAIFFGGAFMSFSRPFLPLFYHKIRR